MDLIICTGSFFFTLPVISLAVLDLGWHLAKSFWQWSLEPLF